MSEKEDVVEVLSEVLSAELTAVNQYFLHSKIVADWGFNKLAQTMKADSDSEMKHVDVLVQRILYLKGMPDMQKYMKIKIGSNIEEILRFDLNLEIEAVHRLNRGIKIATDAGDNGSADLLKTILKDEEEHIEQMESFFGIIQRIGVDNFLASQI